MFRVSLFSLIATLGASWGAIEAHAQTVQLPTVRRFGVQTTVSVPDGGMAPLGGVSSVRRGSVTRGVPGIGRLPLVGRPFNNHGFGSNLTSNQAFVRAQILDLRAMDEAVLNEAAARRTSPAPDREAQFLAEHLGRGVAANATSRRAVSRQPLPVTSSNVRTQELLELGDQALQAGNYELATQYYAAAEGRTAPGTGRVR